MSDLLNVILPVFLVIGFGYAAAWRGLFSDSAVDGLMRFAQNFAVPVLLARSIAKLDLGASYDAGLMISFYAGAFLSFAIGLAAARLWLGRSPEDAVAIGFCCLFSNSLLLGIPITERAFGAGALAGNFAIISIHSPLLYTAGILAMEATRSAGGGLGAVAVNALKGVLRTPLVIGILTGFTIQAGQALSGQDLPEPVWAAMDMVARAALPAALFGLGGVLLRYRPEGDSRAIAMIAALSLLIHPGTAYLLGRFGFGLGTEALRSAVMTAAMAPGVNAYLFANMYGAAKRVAASAVLVATALSILTIWGWLAILP
ncbi:malonate transporter [Rhodobacter xanthinilyticus]|uniref:Malonate transporter n=1 Tax=Rhodobacter xanthinilyticus TaxID=1850250 RepID=A0A1D9MDY0_9RHOB|nr:AEC family transporter [Rhodobacter xanthinilyticus]AOZ70085.1 malonate transporter [Rhodobacter xanthinilyticus]